MVDANHCFGIVNVSTEKIFGWALSEIITITNAQVILKWVSTSVPLFYSHSKD